MPIVKEKIIAWAKTLPYWERAALQKIIDGADLKEADYDELVQYLLEDAGLKEVSGERPQLNISEIIENNKAESIKRRRLKRIYDVRNVNALAEGQELPFSPNLTVIYGNNGSGKSGYARIIGNTSFTRGDKQVLMDITQKYNPSLRQTVSFEFDTDGKIHTLKHELGTPCPEMDMFHVFDSTSARVHLIKQNTLSFVPSGLEYLTQLAEVTDKARSYLDKEIRRRQQTNYFISHFAEETEIKKHIENLDSDTDLQVLRQLAILTDADLTRLNQLENDINLIKKQDATQEIQNAQRVIADFESLTDKLEAVRQALDSAKIETVNRQIAEWYERQAIIQSLSRKDLETSRGYQIGAPLWFDFISAAHKVVVAESTSLQSYPQADDTCLFCNQPLSVPAREHIEQLWTLLENDVQSGLRKLENRLQTTYDELEILATNFFHDQLVSYRHLETYDQQISAGIQIFLKDCESYRQSTLTAIREKRHVTLQTTSTAFLASIANIIQQLEAKILWLQSSDKGATLSQLKQEKIKLQHRQKLEGLLPEIELFVQNAQWIAQAEKPKTRRSTQHISKQYNALFDELVTQRYIELFEHHLQTLRFPAKIEIATKAQKGKTLKQLTLKTDKSMPTNLAQADKVLSEGEQKAVALADFLTEVVLDDNCSAIVLDDPVTSLDFAWKDLIAPILVEEATRQQVIIFTHDLHFLYCLKEAASKYDNLELAAHWIEKREDIPGWVFQNNTPASEHEYKSSNKALTFWQQARKEPPEQQQSLLQSGFAALRTSYEAFVVFDLFGSVVMRFNERISIERLKDAHVDPYIRDSVIEKVGLLSRYIEGHLHSDPYIAQKPTPEMLKQEIDEFIALQKRQKELKKTSSTK